MPETFDLNEFIRNSAGAGRPRALPRTSRAINDILRRAAAGQDPFEVSEVPAYERLLRLREDDVVAYYGLPADVRAAVDDYADARETMGGAA